MNGLVRRQGPSERPALRDEKGERNVRPWGTWEVLTLGSGYALKRIEVNPGRRLSSQCHEFRSERWMIVEGCAEIEIDGETQVGVAGDYVVIPMQAAHRIKSVGTSSLILIAVQIGYQLD